MSTVAEHGGARLTAADLTVTSNAASSSSITFPNATLITVIVLQIGSAVVPGTPSVAGSGSMAFTRKSACDLNFGQSDPNDTRISVFTGVGNGAAETLNITGLTNTAFCHILVCSWDNADLTGTNGTNGIRQGVPNSGASTTASATLAALRDTESMGVAYAVSPATLTVTAPSSPVTDESWGISTPFSAVTQGIHKSNGGTAWSCSLSSDNWGIVAFEIVSATVTASVPTPIFGPAASFANAPNGQYGIVGNGVNAKVFAAYVDGSGNVKAQLSTDAFATIGSAVTVDTGMNMIPLDQPMVFDMTDPTHNGRIHLIYGSGAHSSPCAIYHRYSDNDGATWSARHTIDDGTSYSGNRFVRVGMTARGGVVNVVYGYEADADFSAQTGGLTLRRSTDGGNTFGAKTQPWSGSVRTTGVGVNRPVMKDDGATLHLTWSDTGSTTVVSGSGIGGWVYESRSSDNGVSWATQRIAQTSDFGVTYGMGRPHVHSGANGKVVVVGMADLYSGATSDLWLIRSTDNGASWGAPTKLVTHPTGKSISHPLVEGKGNLMWCCYCLVDPGGGANQLYELHSTDGGASWTTPRLIFTYVTLGTTGADAPWMTSTSKRIIAAVDDYSGSGGDLVSRLRLPAYMSLPDPTQVITDATGLSNAGPPPTGSWTTTNGNCVNASTNSGDGLRIVSNKIANGANATFRQGNYVTAAPSSPDEEFGIRLAGLPGAAFDGFSLYARMLNPHTANHDSYGVDYFSTNTPPLTMNRKLNSSNVVSAPGFPLDRQPTIATGDVIWIQTVGTGIRLWYVAAGTKDYELLGDVVDANLTLAGQFGLDIVGGNGNVKVDQVYGRGGVADPTFAFGNPVYNNDGSITITGVATVGATLTAAHGNWTPAPSGYTYRWQRADDALGTNLTDIPGATSSTYVLQQADYGKYIRVGVTALP